jgi:hypothetical protein
MGAVFTGCILAGSQILHDLRIPVRLLPSVAARVNGFDIDAGSVDRTVAGMDARAKAPASEARAHVVSRMIDEELLVQHALASGAAETDPEVRAALVRAAAARVNQELAAQTISDLDLEEYYRAHRLEYAAPARYEVTPFYFNSTASAVSRNPQQRASATLMELHLGQSLDKQRHNADFLPFDPPSRLASARTLANYYGVDLVDQLANVSAGQTTQIVAFGNGVAFLYVNRKIDAGIASLESIHDLVLADALRAKQDRALETLLTSLRSRARIEINAGY